MSKTTPTLPRALPVALALIAVAGALRVQDNGVAADGAVCPPGRWYVDGGNACRNASSANPPLLREPTVRWRQHLDGRVVGEPLVWDDIVVVALQPANDKRRVVQARNLEDGALIAERSILSTADMLPSLWGREIVSRVGSDGLELLRIGARSIDSVARIPRASSVGPPLRFGTAVWVVIDGRLTCLRAADFRVLWQSDDGGYAGPVSLLGSSVYALRRGGDGWSLCRHDRQTGAMLQRSGPVGLQTSASDDARVQLTGRDITVRFGSGPMLRDYRGESGVEPNAVRLPLEFTEATPLQAMALPALPACDDRVRLVVTGPPSDRHLGMFRDGTDQGVRLDTNAHHRALIDAPPTVCGDVFYLGPCAVAVEDLRVLWRLCAREGSTLPLRRVVPAGHSLVLAADDELIAIGDDAPADTVAGQLRADEQQRELARLQQLVDAAAAASDWGLAQELLARCRELAADEGWATKRDKDLERRSKRSKAKVDDQRAARVREQASRAAAVALDAICTDVLGWVGQRADAEVRRGLRYVLGRHAADAAAVAAVRAMLPPELPVPAKFDALEWLQFLDAMAQTPVRFLEASLEEFGDGDLDSVARQSKQQLLEWRSRWRSDLQALQSGRLLMFSPVDAPGSIANALSTGELVCDALESMFADVPAVRQDPRPMLVFLYSDRDEYLRESDKVGYQRLGWTAGYYSDQELVPKSRLFVPGSATGFAGVLPTLAHELTHQWLMDRCPAFHPDKGQVMAGRRAYWIVEGFASMLEQFDFDLQQRRFAVGKGDLRHVDLVASAGAEQLLDWEWLVRAGRRDYLVLTVQPGKKARIESNVRMGLGFEADRITMFYAQSAMLCRFLYEADGGSHRRALLDYVAAYYTGRTDDLDFEEAFGARAGDLAPRVVAMARELVR